MGLALMFALVDAIAAVYLLAWALRRQRRDKPLVTVVGAVLAVCAVFLTVVSWPRATESAPPSLPPLPAAPGSPV